MGRRKIEIQPITHERNRSVTFIKRKNGLFKKAYELGVLCSVEVAVIIFEERPGHQPKLYQYSSKDIRSIVKRHAHHDGPRDAKTPADFTAGASSAKFDDSVDPEGDGDGDDGDDDDDNARSPGPPMKRSGNGKQKMANFAAGSSTSSGVSATDLLLPANMEYQPHHRGGMNMQHPSTLPVSGERLSHHNPAKKPRLMTNMGGGTSIGNASPGHASSDDQYPYQPSPQGSSTSLRAQQQQPHYTFFNSFPQQAPQSYLLGPSFDFANPASSPPARSSSAGQHNPSFHRSSPTGYHDLGHNQHQHGIYNQILRNSSHTRHRPPPAHSALLPDLFTSMPDASDQLRQHTAQAQHPATFSSMEWPIHTPPVTGPREPAPGSDQTTWLDFLSGNPSAGTTATTTTTTSSSGPLSRALSIADSWDQDRRDRNPAFGSGAGNRAAAAAAFSENGGGVGLDDNAGSDHQMVESDGHSTSDAENINISGGMRGSARKRSVNAEDAGGEGMDNLASE